MFEFDVTRWVPQFILNDKNGYAIAKAIEAAMRALNSTLLQGTMCLSDFDSMPEWRLDELAWEYNCPYDYNAGVETKRKWIREANTLSALYGTPEAIYQYLSGYFDQIKIEEAWEYGGEPFHFRVIFSGAWMPEKVAWATKAVHTVKNVRSVLDNYIFKEQWKCNLFAGCALYAGETGTFHVPAVEMDNVDWYIDENGDMLLDENGILLIVEG